MGIALDTTLYGIYTWSRPERQNPAFVNAACDDPPNRRTES
jgi:hypothetical protein